MIRIFSHFVSTKTTFLVSLEALILMLACYAGISFQSAVYGSVGGLSVEALVFPLAMLIMMSSMGLYQLDLWEEVRSVQMRLPVAVLVGTAIAFAATSYLAPSSHLQPDGIAITLIAALAGSGLIRLAFYKWGDLDTFKPRILVIGTGSRVMKLAEYAKRSHNHEVVGYVALQPTTHYVPESNVLSFGPGESLLSIVDKHKINQIVIAVRDRRGGGLPVKELLQCRLRGVQVTEMPTFFEREYRQVSLESINPSWMVFGDGFSGGGFRPVVKRLFDVLASFALLVLTLPVMLLTAFCIFVESGFPIFYRQQRVGQGGRVFSILKFRSMELEAEKDGTPRWAAANDDRTTRVGRIIRKLRIDELPQIINILRGEMSFVGPRPERPFFVDKLVEQVPYYALRHSIKPGLTGWAQVRCPYGASIDDSVEKLQYDLYYVKNHGLFHDLLIVFATVEVVLWGKGAR